VNELGKRVLLALIAAPLFLWVIWLGGWYFRILMLIIGLLVLYEVQEISEKAGLPVNPVMTYLLGIWLLWYPLWPYSDGIGLALLAILFVWETLRPGTEVIKRISGTLFCGLYAPAGFLAFQNLRFIGALEGFIIILGLLFMVWGNDTFAYFIGRQFGKHPMAPSISPKKTWEGFIGGFPGAATGLFLTWLVAGSNYPFTLSVSIGLIIITSIFGPIGDLVESRFKRIAGVKDSGSLLPGHGGFFDRFDALILSSVAVFFYIQITQLISHAAF
jgi:phosphatidate cytidylyltransferase